MMNSIIKFEEYVMLNIFGSSDAKSLIKIFSEKNFDIFEDKYFYKKLEKN